MGALELRLWHSPSSFCRWYYRLGSSSGRSASRMKIELAEVLLPTTFYLKIKAVPLMHFYLDGQQ